MREIVRYSGCIVCGDQNDIGLQAKFYFDDETGVATTTITADEKFAGYKNILHGGIVSSLLDEIMIKSILARDIYVVTAEMTTRFRKPVYTGDTIIFEGKETGHKGSVYFAEGRALNQHGEIVANATGKFVKPRSELADRLLDSLEKPVE